MTKRIVKNLDLLKALNQCNTSEQKQLLKTARPELVNAICDCVHNILQGNIPITQHQKKKLKGRKKVLRQLVLRKNKTARRKNLLVQHGGGFLSSILGPVLKTIAGALGI